ncbi:MAG: polymer-forming cytoskeletal protein [Lachnospiraceae bacterium]|nr:polymer-forming cytoskeletal protein [Lachnospiraceae bacterium]
MGKRNRGNVATGENTVIGEGTVIKGDIVSDSAVIRVDGQVDGGIQTKGDLIIATQGVVNGDVTATNLNLAGKILGDVEIGNKIEIEANGKLLGNISTKLLAMDETAVIQGNVNMTSDTAETADNKTEEKPASEAEDKADAPKEDSKAEDNA